MPVSLLNSHCSHCSTGPATSLGIRDSEMRGKQVNLLLRQH